MGYSAAVRGNQGLREQLCRVPAGCPADMDGARPHQPGAARERWGTAWELAEPEAAPAGGLDQPVGLFTLPGGEKRLGRSLGWGWLGQVGGGKQHLGCLFLVMSFPHC